MIKKAGLTLAVFTFGLVGVLAANEYTSYEINNSASIAKEAATAVDTAGVWPNPWSVKPQLAGVWPNPWSVKPQLAGVWPNPWSVKPQLAGVWPNPWSVGTATETAGIQPSTWSKA